MATCEGQVSFLRAGLALYFSFLVTIHMNCFTCNIFECRLLLHAECEALEPK